MKRICNCHCSTYQLKVHGHTVEPNPQKPGTCPRYKVIEVLETKSKTRSAVFTTLEEMVEHLDEAYDNYSSRIASAAARRGEGGTRDASPTGPSVTIQS